MNTLGSHVTVTPLLTADQIHARVDELAAAISRDYADTELLVVGILKGAWVFVADLVRKMKMPVFVDFIVVSSYGTGTESSGQVKMVLEPGCSIEGRDVLVVEDILDTGMTLAFVLDRLRQRHPRSLKLCVLMDKPARRRVAIRPDYVGFEIPDRFVAGYGADSGERFRNLPFVGYVKEAP